MTEIKKINSIQKGQVSMEIITIINTVTQLPLINKNHVEWKPITQGDTEFINWMIDWFNF